MLLKSLLLFFVGSLNILVGLIVLARDYKRFQNQAFFVFSFGLGGWVIGIGGFLLAQDADAALAWAKAYYTFPLILCASMALFARSFPDNSKVPKSWWIPIMAGFFITVIPLLASPTYLTQSLAYHDWGKEIILNKTHYIIYSIYLMGCFIAGLIYVYIKSTKLQGFRRLQARYFFIGFLLTSFFGVMFNLFYPWFGNYRLIWLGPLFTNAFILSTGYSIIRHRLFDIRAVAARSLGYIFSVMSLAVLYGLITFNLMNEFIFSSATISLPQKTAFTLLAVGIAFTYQPLKNFFDRITNKFFFRDTYQTQAVLDKIGEIIVGNIDSHKIQAGALQVLDEALKPTQGAFLLIDAEAKLSTGDFIGKRWTIHSPTVLQQTLSLRGKKITVLDEIEDFNSKLAEDLRDEDINLVAPMTIKDKTIGYLLFGPKKNGSMYSSQDIGLLSIVTNELAVAIQNAQQYEEIQSFNITLQEKIEEATRKLRRSNEKLKQMDETKDDFISMASHQLRTPLTSVKGYISMVLDGDTGKITAQQRKLLDQAFISSQRMVYLIADLLNVSRLKTGKFIIEAKPLNLADLVDGEIDQLKATAKDRDLTLEYHKPASFPTLNLDETKVRQVIMNYIDNAIYYTPAGGHISVNLEDKPESIEFTVVDDGIGVPKAEQPHLFTKFYRAGNAKKARPDGTGLGLFMAKKVIIAQGGAAIFHSEEGKGSTFGFSFPKNSLQVK